MIKINLELWPKGNQRAKRHLGTISIANDCTGTLARGNYKYRLSQRGRPDSEWRSGRISGFPRRKLTSYDLLYRILEQEVGKRNS